VEVVAMRMWRLVLAGLVVAASVAGCSEAETDSPAGPVEAGLVSVPEVVGEVLEPLDAECQSVAFSDGTLFWALGGVEWASRDEFVTDPDGRVLQVVTWVDTPCGERADRTMERVTVGWYEIDDTPEYWSQMEVLAALDHAAGDGFQLTRSCYLDEEPWPTVVALIDEDTLAIEGAWRIDDEGQLSDANVDGVACYPEELLP
jgi:hypothetical protein